VLGAAARGVIEGTENGARRYESQRRLAVPVYSVARSPLKYPENHLVGAGVVFSVEDLVRSRGEVLQGRRACVLGYGRIGRGVAQALRGRGIDTTVFDIDAVAVAEAAAQGFQVSRVKERALRGATIVIGASGGGASGHPSLSGTDYTRLSPGAYLASVTSSDDEFDLQPLKHGWSVQELAPNVTLYRQDDLRFHVLAGGNAINFAHGAVLGPSIHLIEAEKSPACTM